MFDAGDRVFQYGRTRGTVRASDLDIPAHTGVEHVVRFPCGTAEASYPTYRTEGHTQTTISGDTRAECSEAFALVPSLWSATCDMQANGYAVGLT